MIKKPRPVGSKITPQHCIKKKTFLHRFTKSRNPYPTHMEWRPTPLDYTGYKPLHLCGSRTDKEIFYNNYKLLREIEHRSATTYTRIYWGESFVPHHSPIQRWNSGG
jgi:hypothetical protein